MRVIVLAPMVVITHEQAPLFQFNLLIYVIINVLFRYKGTIQRAVIFTMLSSSSYYITIERTLTIERAFRGHLLCYHLPVLLCYHLTIL